MDILIKFLWSFLRPAATPGDEDQPELDLQGDEEPPAGDPPADEPPADEPPADDPPKPAQNADRERADRLEREMADLRARQAPPPPAPAADKDVENWQKILADPASNDAQRWYAHSNLEIRATKNFSQTALTQAMDIFDKTAFASLAIKEPAMFKRYEGRVEEELAKMRARGQNTAREAIYTFLLGKDMREGKFQKKKTAPKPGASADQPAVQRGRLPGARSDVRGGTGMTEHEKRAKRLENVQI